MITVRGCALTLRSSRFPRRILSLDRSSADVRRRTRVRQQAARLGVVVVHLRADRRRRRPERHGVGHRGERGHVVGTPRRAVVLDVLPEVPLGAFRALDHRIGGLAERPDLRHRSLETVLDLEEDALVAGRLGDGDGRADLGRVGQDAGGDAGLDELLGVDRADVERLVLRVADHVGDAGDVRQRDLQLRDGHLEVRARLDQLLATDTEVRGRRQLDELLDGAVAEQQLGVSLAQRTGRRHRQRDADLAGGLVVDTPHGGPPWYVVCYLCFTLH